MASDKLGYEEQGTGDVLLLVHGFPLDRTMWSEQLSGLSDIRRVVAVDLPGRGKSAHVDPEGSTIDDYADCLAATLDDLGAASADVAGLSMGGYVVMALARRHPDKVRSLIFIDTKAGDDAPEAKEGRDKTAALVRESGTGALLEGLFPKMFAPGTTDAVKDGVKRMFEDLPGMTAAADAIVMRDRPDSTPGLAAAKVPVLVLHGAEDQLMPIAVGEALAAATNGAKFVSVPSAGHMAPVENPEAVNEAIRSFLNQT